MVVEVHRSSLRFLNEVIVEWENDAFHCFKTIKKNLLIGNLCKNVKSYN